MQVVHREAQGAAECFLHFLSKHALYITVVTEIWKLQMLIKDFLVCLYLTSEQYLVSLDRAGTPKDQDRFNNLTVLFTVSAWIHIEVRYFNFLEESIWTFFLKKNCQFSTCGSSFDANHEVNQMAY